MRLSRFFGLILLLAFIPALLLALLIVAAEWRDCQRTERAIAGLEVLQDALNVMQQISFERGPANGALGADIPPDPAITARLAGARAASDAAIATLAKALAGQPGGYEGEALPVLMLTIAHLHAARHAVDQTLALPLAGRTPAVLHADVQGMFGVVDAFAPVINELSENVAQSDPRLVDALIVTYEAVQLREYAGRLGSAFTAALAARQPLSPGDIQQIERYRGRIDGQAAMLALNAGQYAGDPAVRAALVRMQHDYLGDDLAYVENVVNLYRNSGDAGITTAQFAQRYVPEMGTIVATRDAVMDMMRTHAGRQHDAARRVLVLVALAAAAAIFAYALLLMAIRRRVLRPLLRATKLVRGLGAGDLSADIPEAPRADEMGDLFRAISALKRQGIDRMVMEQDREEMIRQLLVSAATDFLTGLPNRRDFYRTGEHLFAQAQRYLIPLAMIAVDIDHFKEVNDLHGHQGGDAVLVEVAHILQEECRKDNLICRYGGEEFLVLAPLTDGEDALRLAERLRICVEAAEMVLPEGGKVRVTASFGIALNGRNDASLDHMIRRADRALYAAKAAGRNRVETEKG